MNPHERAAPYREEARQRWGESDAYRESERRTASYTKADWDAIEAESAEISRNLAALMDRPPADPAVQTWIARHHRQIDERFYRCSPEIYRGLADLYVDDQRFGDNIDRARPGLARFMREAMRVYADRLDQAS